jgi:AraC-like DNA-binding protein
MSDCIDFKEPANSPFSRWARPSAGLDDGPLAPQPISDRAAELTRELRRAWLEKNLETYVQLLRDLAPEFGYSSRGLARALRITPRHLQRVFAAILGRAPQAWLNEERLLAARRMLQTACTVKEVAYSLGFHSASQLSRDFKSHFGVAPSTFLVAQYARSCPRSLQDVRPVPDAPPPSSQRGRLGRD